MHQTIEKNFSRIRERIAGACERSGRSVEDITIVAVTKTHDANVVDAAIDAGVSDVGENRIQEFLDKRSRVRGQCRWHFIGTLQRNKASHAIGVFEMIHSLDRVKLAHTLSRLSVEAGTRTRALVEVNTSGETSKHGFAPGDVQGALEEIVALPNLDIEGLMTIGPLTDDESAIRGAFRELAALRDGLSTRLGRPLGHLSMGMSDDFEIAIEEGATIIRLGRVLFGPRGTYGG